MALNLEGKKAIVANIAAIAQSSLSGVAAEYNGLTALQMTRLRAKARQQNITVHVVRNTLAARAFENTRFASMSDHLVGPLVLVFCKDDPGAAARLVRDFSKDNNKLVAKVLCVDGQVYDRSQLETIATLPTHEQALSQLLSALQAPMAKLARTLAEPPAKLARTLAALRDQKGGAA